MLTVSVRHDLGTGFFLENPYGQCYGTTEMNNEDRATRFYYEHGSIEECMTATAGLEETKTLAHSFEEMTPGPSPLVLV